MIPTNKHANFKSNNANNIIDFEVLLKMLLTSDDAIKPPRKIREQLEIEELLTILLAGLIRDGAIDPVGKTREQLIIDLRKFAAEFDLAPVIDHTKDILTQARPKRNKETKNSHVFFMQYGLNIR